MINIILLSSCINDGTTNISSNISNEGIFGEVFVKEVSYNNHSFLEFKDKGLQGQGWVHNPDCKCFKDSI